MVHIKKQITFRYETLAHRALVKAIVQTFHFSDERQFIHQGIDEKVISVEAMYPREMAAARVLAKKILDEAEADEV